MFEPNPVITRSDSSVGTVSYDGIINRTGFLTGLTIIASSFTWFGLHNGSLSPSTGTIAAIAGLILGLIIIFTRCGNPLLISLYAGTQGLSLGVITYFANLKYPGIAVQALGITFGCFGAALLLYKLKVLRATPGFTKFIIISMVGILGLYLVDIVSTMFGHPISVLNDSSPMSIAISAGIVLIATISFILDFSAVDDAVSSGCDSSTAWHLSFGLLVGLIWLYVEVLRLLIKLRSRD